MNDKKKCRSVNFFNIIATEEHKGSLNQNYFLYWLNIYLSKDIFSKTWPNLDHLDFFEFIFCQEIWWLWWKPGELNLSMSAEKMIIVVYSQEMRGNLCLHCPKLPHPFSHKKCIHLDDNAWKKFLIFYKGRREDAFNPLFIQRSGFGWYEGTDKINSNCRSPSQRR